MTRRLKSLGVNYLWGLCNFTAGVAAGGTYVAAILVAHGLAR